MSKISSQIKSKNESINIFSVSKNKNFKKLYQIIFQQLFNKKVLINDQFLFKSLNKTKVKKAEYFINKILSLPMYYNLNYKQIDYVCEHLIKFKELK